MICNRVSWWKKNKGHSTEEDSIDDMEEVEEVYHDTASFLNANEIGDVMRSTVKGGSSKQF